MLDSIVWRGGFDLLEEAAKFHWFLFHLPSVFQFWQRLVKYSRVFAVDALGVLFSPVSLNSFGSHLGVKG